jgi:hypothetical protein
MWRAWRAPASEEKNSLYDFEIASTKKDATEVTTVAEKTKSL